MHKVTLRVEENWSPERRSKLHQVMLRSQKKRKKKKVKAQSCSVNLKKVRRKVFQKLPLTNSRSQLLQIKRREFPGNRQMTVKRRSKRPEESSERDDSHISQQVKKSSNSLSQKSKKISKRNVKLFDKLITLLNQSS